MNAIARLKQWERDLRVSDTPDLTDPTLRRRAWRYTFWIDHGCIRTFWTNEAEIAPGVFRSNQPCAKRVARLKSRGIDTIITLRGDPRSAPSLLEAEACNEVGIKLLCCPLTAREAPGRHLILNLIDAFRNMDGPFVMHCKSGADRASLASAIYLLEIKGASVTEARRMLALRFLHLKWTRTGILDYILDRYEAASNQSPIGFADWVARDYDAQTIQDAYDRGVPAV